MTGSSVPSASPDAAPPSSSTPPSPSSQIQSWVQHMLARLPGHGRKLLLPVAYGLAGAAAALLFRFAVDGIYSNALVPLLKAGPLVAMGVSFAVVISTSLLSGIIVARFCPEAAGSGIPKVKAAFWQDGGYIPLRLMLTKFVAGALTIGGGASLGREGPSVQLAAAAASNIAGAAGMARDQRRAALSAGAAAGLASAFNTPISAITFVLEEVLEDLNNATYLSGTLLAAVVATLVTHLCVGDQPAFIIPAIADFSPTVYLAAPIVGGVAACVGVLFQVLTLNWRDWIRHKAPVPPWLQPVIGAMIAWAVGISVLLSIGHLGVFGLGYADLEAMVHGNMIWQFALILLVAKLVATSAAYAWNGCGGIFAPVLFLGASAGLACASLLGVWLHFTQNDIIVLVVVGMSTCLGAVVRAPITSMLIVFEMTHQFAFVPVLMLGTIVSQAVSRRLVKDNFYTDILARDGIHIEKIMPPKSLADWHLRDAATITNFTPVLVTSLQPADLRDLLTRSPHQSFPVMENGSCIGILQRAEAECFLASSPASTSETRPALQPAVTIRADDSIRYVGPKLLETSSGMLVVLDFCESQTVIGIITLHDLVHGEIKAAG
ncbi:MAG: chloride channel protein [Candidatus Methylacidiphilales bacterium]